MFFKRVNTTCLQTSEQLSSVGLALQSWAGHHVHPNLRVAPCPSMLRAPSMHYTRFALFLSSRLLYKHSLPAESSSQVLPYLTVQLSLRHIQRNRLNTLFFLQQFVHEVTQFTRRLFTWYLNLGVLIGIPYDLR